MRRAMALVFEKGCIGGLRAVNAPWPEQRQCMAGIFMNTSHARLMGLSINLNLIHTGGRYRF